MPPLYDFNCDFCKSTFEALAKMDQYEADCNCGYKAKRVVATPWLKIDINSDRWVTRHKNRGKGR